MINKKFKKFPKEEDLRLSRRFKEKGDNQAFNELVENNMWIVKRVAFKFANRGVELEDLIQEGCIALLVSAKKFNYKRGCRLSTYAVIWIKRYIILEIIKKRDIHIPEHIQKDFLNINKTKDFLKEKSGKEVSLREISNETGLSIKEIKFIYEKMNMHCASLDDSVKFKKSESSGNKKISEVIGDISFSSVDKLLEFKEELGKIMKIVLNMINQFSKRKQSIFYEYFGLNENFQSKTLEEVAQKFSCGPSNVGQHIQRILIDLYIGLKKNGYEIQKNRTRIWLSEKIDLCCWLQETTGARFNILEYKKEIIKQ